MDKINFDEAPEQKVQNTEKATPKYVKPGKHQLTCTGLTESPSDLVGKPYITVGFVDDNGSQLNQKLFMSDAARKWTILKLKKLIEASEQLIPDGDLTVESLNSLLAGKRMWIKVSGEEAMKQFDGETSPKKVVYGNLAGFNFAASISNGDSLSFDESKDIVRLGSAATGAVKAPSDELPF